MKRIVLGLLVGGVVTAVSHGAELRLGVAAQEINPPTGIGLAGYYHERGSEGVLDDLQAKVMVLDDGRTKAAIVVCDLIAMPQWIVDEARKLVEARTGIPGAHVMIAATHTHTAPVLYREWSRDESDGAAKPIAREYSARLPERIAAVVAAGLSNLQPVRVSVAKGLEEQLAHNRRYWMRDGSVGWNPGKLNRDIVRPAGPTDPEVGVFFAETTGVPPAPVLTFVNFAMHPDTTGGLRVSADYPGALARALALYRGPGMLTLFANGTCGNLNHTDVHWRAPQSGPHEANRLGTILAAAVFKSYPRLVTLTNAGSLQVSRARVELPLPPFTPQELEEARVDARTAQDNTRAGFMKLVRSYRVLDTAARAGRPLEVEVQVITLGRTVAWVSWPGEMFVELGLMAKAGSPFPHTYNVELANGTIGYIPNKSAFPEGNYEVESARAAPGSGELLATTALRLLTESFAAGD